VLFSITGSGQTIGVAIYTFDDLPDRMRDGRVGDRAASSEAVRSRVVPQPRICIESLGTAVADQHEAVSSLRLAARAAAACLDGSAVDPADVAMILHAGVYRDEFLSEPAIAALIAGQLKINDDVTSPDGRRTLAFDVINGGLGFLNACHVATQLIAAGRGTAAMVVASEIESNKATQRGQPRGVTEVGSAVMLRRSKSGTSAGFGRFLFTHDTSFRGALAAHTRHERGTTYLHIERDPKVDRYYLERIAETVTELLRLEGLDRSMIKTVLPPQVSTEFLSELTSTIGVPRDRIVDVAAGRTDYFTSSIAFGLQYARTHGLAEPGDIGLIISVGSGIQAGCATYYF